MNYHYNIDSTILNILTRFYELHGALYASVHLLPGDIKKELSEKVIEIAAFGAVVKNTNLVKKLNANPELDLVSDLLPKEQIHFFKQYKKFLLSMKQGRLELEEDFNISKIIEIHNHILGVKSGVHFRTAKKRLSASYVEDGITYTVRSEVKTPPDQIERLLKDFLDWLNNNIENSNGLIAAAVTYFNIASIHPFQRGNGRMSKLLSRLVLSRYDIDSDFLLSIDDYFVTHQHYYYKVIESCIQSGDITDWIEFYCKAMLSSVTQAAEFLSRASGGSIDIKKNRFVELTPREMRALRIIMKDVNISGASVARQTGTTRQNVHEILNNLIAKGLIKKTGKNTGTRYSYVP